jgi:CBS domain-containing protein
MANQETTDIQLLRLYNEIDAFMRQQYKKDRYADHSFLIQELASSNRVIARYQQDMRAVAQLRNSLVHNPFSNAQPIAQPHPKVVEHYQEIRNALLTPHSALSIAIPTHKIYTVSMDTNLNEVLRIMDKNIYTHVPVIENDKMIGLLSENTLLSYLAEVGETVITNDMTVADLAAYLPLKSHRSESFVFLPRKASLSQVFKVFNDAIRVHNRIGMVFITEHGEEHEKPLGIITAWDLASPEFVLQ